MVARFGPWALVSDPCSRVTWRTLDSEGEYMAYFVSTRRAHLNNLVVVTDDENPLSTAALLSNPLNVLPTLN